GAPPPDTYKGLVCTPAGWAGEARMAYPWPDAEAKARAALAWIKGRARANGIPVEEWYEEYFGVNAYGGPTVDLSGDHEPSEVIGRLAWRTADAESAGRVSQGSGVLGLSGPPTISSTGRGRDGRPTQLLAVDAFPVDRKLVDSQVRVEIEAV
ncbi:MAG: acyclic terpene utilization AtuA family protein, partial [Actinobacteria bacterium]|nr:acyclic terpene utilization AtuA family protein [Actinomycetota bacterium]